MELSKTETLNIDISGNELARDYEAIAKEWINDIAGSKWNQAHQRERQIEKVPPLLLTGERNSRNRECYEPVVVSLGPYHHNKSKLLAKAEAYKVITLKVYVLSSEKAMDLFYSKVLEVIHVARKCYIDGSTEDYDDGQFAMMMLRDGCFILFFIECISCRNMMLMLNNEYLGALGFANLIRDFFLLENQIPFVVLQVLMNLKYDDGGEEILNKFFNYLNYGEVIYREVKVFPGEDEKQPLHLLELYRAYFITIPCSSPSPGSGTSGKWQRLNPENNTDDTFNYVKRNRSFPSVMELKAKGIFLKPASIKSSEHIKFHSHLYYGQLEIANRAISGNSKAIFLNMIAYEMCPHNPNDFRVATYIRFMKSLIVHPDDVKELRSRNILLHSLGRDDEVVKMYDEIDTPAVNSFMFSQLKGGIEKHCCNMYKTWVAELITLYFSRPWKTLALFVATAILVSNILQTMYTVEDEQHKSAKM